MTQINLSIKQKQTYSIENKLVVAKGEEAWERDGMGVKD